MSKNTPKPDWVPFYNEFAHKLLKYKDDRKPLLDWMYKTFKVKGRPFSYSEKGSSYLEDVDPFTIIGIFNRIPLTEENRLFFIENFKKFLSINADVPKNYIGVPTLNNQRQYFFGFKKDRDPKDIDNLWNLFEKVLKQPYEIEDIFNKVRDQLIININLTMGLFWILPDFYIALDRTNRNYLNDNYNFNLNDKLPEFKDYKKIIDDIKEKMGNGEIEENSFIEISTSLLFFCIRLVIVLSELDV